MRERATVAVEPVAEAPAPVEQALATDAQDPPLADKPRERERPRERDRDGERLSGTMRSIQGDEERSLKDWLDIIGTQGAFRIQIQREKPASVTVNGKTVETKGYLETVDETFDDDYLKREFGGGTYTIKVTRRGDDGSYRYHKGHHRTIVIAGDPRVDRLPGNAAAPVAVGGAGESPSIAKAAFEMMANQLERANAQPVRGIDPAVQLLIDQMRRDADARARELSELRAKLDTITSQKPTGDPIKDQILSSLITGEGGRVDSLRAQHASELSQLREHHTQEIRMLNERFDRERDANTRQHDRMVDTIKSGFEREIAAMQNSGNVTQTSNKATFDVQVHTLNGEIKRLERDLTDLRTENRELREKKEQSLLDKLKEIEQLRTAIGGDDEKAASTAWEKIAETFMNPAALEQIGKFFGPKGVPPAQLAAAQAAAQVVAQPQKPVIMRDRRTGQRFAQVANPAGGTQLVPVKKIPQKVAKDDGTQVEVPEVEPSQVAMLVGYLERAFANRQLPDVVAQSGRSMIPENILTWIRDNDGGATSGVDLFMSKVAKLPGTSPLQSQAGRNWLRKVGKALAGDDPAPETETETETETEITTTDPTPPTAAT